ncbi:S8 family serine peptidase [Filibacter tadaridae]|uniref:Thermostable alkaline protease n=1 Tax=Filibacter tadaridae TaxID=2483811 RepID=A0A3P5WH72_9BACL|nr:S8 family serine peptidase [Filibacter tadaridae]VDC19098.1 Thermostable alkaline protease precursor [Filibacter tadaridae]
MWKSGLLVVASLLLIFSLQNVALANEDNEEAYLIVEENQDLLVSFMKENNIPIDKVYSSFSIISANLTKTEMDLVKSKFPTSKIQSNRTYEQSKDTELQSVKSVRAMGEITTPYAGTGVKVAVLDSGVDTEHRDIKVRGGYCSFTNECAPGIPYDDDNGHGTHVAGIIAALNNSTGIVGIAPNVDLYSIKALNMFGVGTTNSLIDGIEWAIKKKIDILNLSITTDQNDNALKMALNAAYQKGILLVGSAGNNGELANKSVMYPAKYDTVIAVSAVNPNLTKLKESAMGPEVEIAAPGGQIFSTYPIEWDFFDGKVDGYTHLSGTSMATPHVTGVLALYKERFPSKTNAELRNLINENTRDLGPPGRDPIFGHGLIQYVKNLPNLVTFQIKNSTGKVFLTPTKPGDIKIQTNGKQINPTNGQWEVYGVAGAKEIVVTALDANGKAFTEKQFIQLKRPQFKDVNNRQSFSEALGFMSNKNQIKGFNDDTFRPYSDITRAEAAALIGRALNFSAAPTKTIFKDVPTSSFASGYIQAAVDAKIISGFSDGTFRPGAYVTRAEMAILISKTFKLEATQTKSFTDVNAGMAAFDAISKLTASGVTIGYSDGTFRPYDRMTRADFTVFSARAQNDFFK